MAEEIRIFKEKMDKEKEAEEANIRYTIIISDKATVTTALSLDGQIPNTLGNAS